MATTQTPVNNGVNVEALLGAREALTATPEGAKFNWPIAVPPLKDFSGWARNRITRPSLLSKRTILKSSPPKIMAPRRWSLYWLDWPAV